MGMKTITLEQRLQLRGAGVPDAVGAAAAQFTRTRAPAVGYRQLLGRGGQAPVLGAPGEVGRSRGGHPAGLALSPPRPRSGSRTVCTRIDRSSLSVADLTYCRPSRIF